MGSVAIGLKYTELIPYAAGTYPLWNWGQIPGILSSNPVEGVAEERAVIEDPRMRKLYDETFREEGLVHLAALTWASPAGIFSNKPITKLADFQGLKTRVYTVIRIN